MGETRLERRFQLETIIFYPRTVRVKQMKSPNFQYILQVLKRLDLLNLFLLGVWFLVGSRQPPAPLKKQKNNPSGIIQPKRCPISEGIKSSELAIYFFYENLRPQKGAELLITM